MKMLSLGLLLHTDGRMMRTREVTKSHPKGDDNIEFSID